MSNQRQCTRNDSVHRMTQMLDSCAAISHDDNAAILLGMAAKALTQLQSHSERVTVEAMDWKEKYEQMGRLFQELESKIDVLDKENGELRAKCQQHEVHLLMGDWDNENNHLELEVASAEVLLKASPTQEVSFTNTNCQTFSGDVYHQLDEFEQSLDLELEDFQRLELLSVGENVNNSSTSHTGDNEQSCSSCIEFQGGKATCENDSMTHVGDSTQEPIKDMPRAPTRNPFHLLQRVFQPQNDVTMPALTTSDSLFSLSSDHSLSPSPLQDLLGFPPAKMTKMSPGPNAEWGIME